MSLLVGKEEMGKYMASMVKKALDTRPAPSGTLLRVPKHERYVFCPDTDWLYSTKMDDYCDFYPLQRHEACEWTDFEGWQFTDNREKVKVDVKYLRTLNEGNTKTMSMIPNAASTNPADWKNKFLVGTINEVVWA